MWKQQEDLEATKSLFFTSHTHSSVSLVFISRRDLHHVLHLEANLITDLIPFALISSLNWQYDEHSDGN